jgi:hypothetical protein
MTPAQAAEAFFDALQQRNAFEAEKFWSTGHDHTIAMFKLYGGMKVISLGKPFKGLYKSDPRPYHGVYVPYVVQLKDGTVKKWQVALACDRQTRRWYYDGGM